MAAATKQTNVALHRTANNVIAVARVAKNSYCDHAGWASKQGSIIKTWKRRYFVLKGRELLYFAERSPSGKGIDEKGRLKVVAVEFTPEFRNGLFVKGELKNQTMKIQLETNDESLEWYAKIKHALHANATDASSKTAAASGSHEALVTMQGWLYKEGQNFKTWKKRFMTLSGRVIKYHARAHEAPLGEAVVNDYNVNHAKPFALDIFSDNNRIFRIAAESFADIQAWDDAIACAISKAPCFGDPYADQKAPFLGETFNETTPQCDGWLFKRGQRATAWKRRFFTLSGFILQYHDSPGESAKGSGSVIDITLVGGDVLDDANVLEIQLDTGRVLTVSADTKATLDVWIHALCAVLEKDPADIAAAAAATPERASFIRGSSNSHNKLLQRGSSLGMQRESQNSFNENDDDEEDDAITATVARKAGWLRKQGKHNKSWKRRFVVVDGLSIAYYEQLDAAPHGSGMITGVNVNTTFPNCLDIRLSSSRVLRVSAETSDEIRSWLHFLVDVLEPPTTGETMDDTDATRRSSLGGSGGSKGSGGSLNSLSRQSSVDLLFATTDASNNSVEGGRGWLMKKGKNFKTWKRRFFTLDGRKLSYAASNETTSPLLGCGLVSYVTLGNARPFCIDVKFQNGRILQVAASNDHEMLAWCKALQAALQAHSSRHSAPDATAGVETIGTEFDFDDNDDDKDDNGAVANSQLTAAMPAHVRHSLSGSSLPHTNRSSALNPPQRRSLGQLPLGSSTGSSGSSGSNLLTRGSSLDSDDSFDDSVGNYMDFSRASLDESLPGCSGWLRKEGSTIKNWKRRYFTLTGTLLSYFKSDNGPLIKSLKVCHVVVMRTKKLCMELTAESGRKLLVAADSSAEYDRWLAALHQAVQASKKPKKDGSSRSSGSSTAPPAGAVARPSIVRL